MGYHAGASFFLAPAWSFTPVFEYNDVSTQFEAPVSSSNPPLIYNSGSFDTASRIRYYNARLSVSSLSLLAFYEPLSRLFLSAGPFAGILIQRGYTETEHITAPSNAVYVENNLHERTVSSNSIGNTNSFQFGLDVGVSYELPFQAHLGLRPSLSATIPLTTVQRATAWRTYPIAASLDLVYHIPEATAKPQIAEVPYPELKPLPSAPPAKRSVLEVSIKALGMETNGQPVSEPVVSIARTHVTEVYPMLHYVFFEDGSSDIPERYYRETAETRQHFDPRTLFTKNALEIHHHVLDIIGQRLAQNRSGSITLIGTRSEHSPGDSAAGVSLSMARAQSIQDYFVSVWGIARERIQLRARNLPEAASDDYNPFGEAENRRVEIVPSSPDITAPLWTERIERIATPPRIEFQPAIAMHGHAGIRSATIMVLQRGRVLRTIDALADSTTNEYQWTIDDRSMPEDANGKEDSLTYIFTAIDSAGDSASAQGMLRVKSEASDVSRHASDTTFDRNSNARASIEKYSLILFDYSSSQLDEKESERILKEMASSIGEHTRVMLTGHTDKTGDKAFNDRLGLDRVNRAEAMLRNELKTIGKPVPAEISVESRGSREALFDNSIPEGRVLSRTVRAVIQNPANK